MARNIDYPRRAVFLRAAFLKAAFLKGSIPQGSIPQGSIPQGSIPQGGIPQGRHLQISGRSNHSESSARPASILPVAGW
jgi:hypothetical protein